MKINNYDILNFLWTHPDWQTANVIGTQFGISTRTVRNHIVDINNPQLKVESSQLGYRLIEQVENRNAPKTKVDLEIQLIYRILTSLKLKVSLADLLASTYYSEFTIRNVITKFNKLFADRKVKLSIKHGMVFLTGTEYERRKIFHELIGQRLIGDVSNRTVSLQSLIPKIPIESLEKTIISIVTKNDLVVNGYALKDLLIHYVVSINRINSGKGYRQFSQNYSLTARPEFAITKTITQTISDKFNVKFNEFEVQGLTLALIGKTLTKDASTKRLGDLQKYVSENVINQCLRVIADVDKEYGLQLNDTNFIIRFAIHVSSLINRSSFSTQQPIEELENLPKQYPLLYDVALFIISDLNERFHIYLSPNESFYIMLHLGSFAPMSINGTSFSKHSF